MIPFRETFMCVASIDIIWCILTLLQLDGHRITDLNVQEYRKHLALVSQEPTLYAGTIRFNILLGAIKPIEHVTQREIEEACRKANILDFIQELPEYVRWILRLLQSPHV